GRFGVDAETRARAQTEILGDARDAIEADGLARLEEVDVARDGEREPHVDAPVHVRAMLDVADALSELDVAVAALGAIRVDELVLEGRERGERFERRAGLERAAHRLVEQGPERILVEARERLAHAIAANAAREI